jgi:multidrug efflux pump
MNFSAIFIQRPVATSLLTLAIALAGGLAFFNLPVSSLPQVDFPTVNVQAQLPGASAETMAATVATPLERALGRIAGVTEMTSSSSQGSTQITLQFDLERDINGACRDVQAAINAAASLLPTGMPNRPTYRRDNPADSPILILALTSESQSRGQMYDVASTILAQKISQLPGIGQVQIGGAALPAVRVELNPNALTKYGIGLEDVRNTITQTNTNQPKGVMEDGAQRWQVQANDQARKAEDYLPLIVSYRNGSRLLKGHRSIFQKKYQQRTLHNPRQFEQKLLKYRYISVDQIKVTYLFLLRKNYYRQNQKNQNHWLVIAVKKLTINNKSNSPRSYCRKPQK